ncbi:MAG: exodeoxyribonuclease VII small subunit [Candidatus Kapabacteria bacterium]|nr:exodeoxyribonuclease VII small subunit [Candidatus Kapabacteria bacterium]
MKKAKQSFEEEFESLQNIVGELDAGDLPFEETVNKYEKGIKTAISLITTLKNAEQRITTVEAEYAKVCGDESDAKVNADEDIEEGEYEN